MDQALVSPHNAAGNAAETQPAQPSLISALTTVVDIIYRTSEQKPIVFIVGVIFFLVLAALAALALPVGEPPSSCAAGALPVGAPSSCAAGATTTLGNREMLFW
jgi:hypothetical protein